MRTFEQSHQSPFKAAGGLGHLRESETSGGTDQTVDRSMEGAGTVLTPTVALNRVPFLHQGLKSRRQFFEQVASKPLQLFFKLIGSSPASSFTFHGCLSRRR